MNKRETSTPRAWQRMLSGRRLDLLDPSPLDVEIGDIAHGLARVARWNGQTSGDHALSVAQHSLIVEEIFSTLNGTPSNGDRLYALLHDAPEYVIGDMISPFKSVMGGNYRDVETRLEAAVHLSFGLAAHPPAGLKKKIKRADQIAAFHEATQLAGFASNEAKRLFCDPASSGAPVIDIVPMPAIEAQSAFIGRFQQLRGSI